jgi:hypothetical protein
LVRDESLAGGDGGTRGTNSDDEVKKPVMETQAVRVGRCMADRAAHSLSVVVARRFE